MKPRKVRHQLFLSAEDSARLARMAEASGRARSDILQEAFAAYLLRRNAPSKEGGFDAPWRGWSGGPSGYSAMWGFSGRSWRD